MRITIQGLNNHKNPTGELFSDDLQEPGNTELEQGSLKILFGTDRHFNKSGKNQLQDFSWVLRYKNKADAFSFLI